MHPFSPDSGVVPLKPYEPGHIDDPPDPPSVADGQLTLDELLVERYEEERRRSSVTPPGRRLLHRVLTGLLEAYTGRRPLAQLTDWLDPPLYRRLRATVPGNDRPRYVLRNIHVCRPAEEALELCGTATAPTRACAVTARFEHGVHGWLCVSFSVLEPG
ncbi:Rv3235 family protein [Saccharomonospora iraqiensis]|uniref:Rv3235 family protein n=1 Tax=Saccharomonospora iraqiensis TaxID=52698 RepID=UPI00022DF8F8|nr:Rv3235 family protein [Saccharomonospora iraqiensis]